MAPLKISEEQNATLGSEISVTETEDQPLVLHPEAYKVKGPSPHKMKSVSSSLKSYAIGMYGLL